MIKAENISFGYCSDTALRDTSLELYKSRLYAIIGPNGAGKSTLMKVLANLKTPSGKRYIDGKEYSEYDRKEFARKLSYLPQVRPVPSIASEELVSHGRFPHLDISRRLKDKDRKIIHSAMEKTGCMQFARKNVSELSGGERQKVYLAMVCAQDTEYVLLDEASSYLDITSQFSVMDILLQMKNDGKCIICVMHDIILALKYADEIILMDKGRVLMQTQPSKICACGILENIFGITCREIIIDGKKEYFILKK